MYDAEVPKLWSETIEAHRHEVRDAILDSAAGLAAENGLLSVTMSQIAGRAGIGRATLYKYFPDVQAVVLAWHDRQIAAHLTRLAEARDHADGAEARLVAVLETYALVLRRRGRHHRQPHGAELAAFVHRDPRVAQAERQVHDLLRDLLTDAAAAGAVRADVPPDELAAYCAAALSAAADVPGDDAARRLAGLVLAGLRA
ncbi:DNA-binding transcriptional regulator, AcrR family [Jiangella alba]|uniref:DNA-binding transcriptional regulator, AcrR family n=1 Tax=Jiangella alba TaxID=561176 RepID=A0A1H5CM49_9ACTN|nr:TetR/AcrR family transcriptional regulator [Jiangella alba]SED67701.1 DNA-binding transcriptional regulator, AcrR family [Jiangella alba]